MSKWAAHLTLATFGALVGCDKDDIGRPCDALAAGDASVSDDRVDTPTVVGQSAVYPCEELICIAVDGKDGYCSKKCRADAGCPDGFECIEVQPQGPFAGDKFCAWKPCTSRSDCGPKEDFCCLPVPDSDPVTPLMRCAFAKKGKCG